MTPSLHQFTSGEHLGECSELTLTTKLTLTGPGTHKKTVASHWPGRRVRAPDAASVEQGSPPLRAPRRLPVSIVWPRRRTGPTVLMETSTPFCNFETHKKDRTEY
jgi:hypothetical protein